MSAPTNPPAAAAVPFPYALAADLSRVPDSLAALRRWTAWQAKPNPKGGKPAKVPSTRTNDPGAWLDFAPALEAARRSTGLGIQLSGCTSLVGLDLDNCRTDEGELTPLAQKILDLAGPTYAEITPSGHGLRIFLSKPDDLQVPEFLSRERGVECYSGASARYLTVTGHKLDGRPSTLAPISPALLSILSGFGGTTSTPAGTAPPLPPGDELSQAEHGRLLLLSGAAGEVLDLLRAGLPPGGRSEMVHGLACRLLEAGTEPEVVHRFFRSSPGLWRYALDKREQDPARAQEFLWAEVQAAVRKVAAGRPPSESEVKAQLQAMARESPERLRAGWADIAAPLGIEAGERVIAEILAWREMDGLTVRPLRRSLTEARAALKAAKERAEQAARTAAVVAGRAEVPWNPLAYNAMLPCLEREMLTRGELLRVGPAYVRLVDDIIPGTAHPLNDKLPAAERLPPPRQVHLTPMNATAMLLRLEQSVCLTKEGEAIEAPPKLPTMLLDLPDKAAPVVAGLVQHPLLLPDGRLLDRPGLDAASGIYVATRGQEFPEIKPRPTRDDAVAAARRLRELVFSETMFRDPQIDGGIAVAAYLLAVARKGLPQAPCVLVNAKLQGTGKTTLVRQLHVVLTDREPAIQVAALESEEFRKAMLSTLLRSPEVVFFDNLDDGSALDNSQLAGVVTSPHYTGRVLGVSSDVTVATNTLFVFTGNDIHATGHFLRRTLEVELLATEAHPEQHRYTVTDPVQHARRVRAEALGCVLTMQAAWMAQREPAEGGNLGFGEAFDRLVTWPLAFAGERGLFEKRNALDERDPAESTKEAVLTALAGVWGVAGRGAQVNPGHEFSPADAVRKMDGGTNYPPTEEAALALRDAVESGDRRRVHSARALGDFFSGLVDQPPRAGLTLRRRSLHGRTIYRVECEVGQVRLDPHVSLQVPVKKLNWTRGEPEFTSTAPAGGEEGGSKPTSSTSQKSNKPPNGIPDDVAALLA